MTVESTLPPLERESYQCLLESAETYRELLLIRLCGEVGLRPAELAALTPDDIEQVRTDPPRYVLRVPETGKRHTETGEDGGESSTSSRESGGRTAYLPSEIERELTRYIRSDGLDEDDRLFSVTPRRLQMLVAAVADRASDRTGDPSLASLSSSDLRQQFAHRTLVTHGIDPRIAKSVGGWSSFESLEPYLTEPTDRSIVDAFDSVEGTENGRETVAPPADENRSQDENIGAVLQRVRDATRAVLEASTHDEIETSVCRALVDGEGYAFAWINRATVADERREWRTTGGIEPSEVESLEPSSWNDDRDPKTSDDDRGREESDDEPNPEAMLVSGTSADLEEKRFEGKVARVPITSGDTIYGTLSVASERENVFEKAERAWLETLGRQIGYAIGAVRRRNLLLSDAVLELEFVCRDRESFFVDVASRLDCRFEIDSFVPVSESTQLYYVTLQSGSPATVFELADEEPGIDDCRLIETYENGWRIEFVVEGSSPSLTLTEYGVTVLETVVENERATIIGECAADADLRAIVAELRSVFPNSELVGKREVERGAQTAREFRSGLADRLTDRQEAALRAAYFGGYYDWPRESTAEEVADAMGVSSPTLHNHLRKGQHELLRTFFDVSEREGSDERSSFPTG